MERSRSKRSYYDDNNSDDYNNNTISNNPNSNKRYQSSSYFSSRHPPPGRLYRPSHQQHHYHHDNLSTPHSICFRILCPDAKAGSVIGKGGSIISSLRRETGARINVQNLIQGDDERVIEVYETSHSHSPSRRLDPDASGLSLSPAQDALLKIHSRINDEGNNNTSNNNSNNGHQANNNGNYEDEDHNRRITTRLVVPRNHVGCLLGKGGKIIEQMREDTKTQIRILPRDQSLPRCVASTEEIVQVVGELNAVKKALRIISTRLKDNPPRERGQQTPHGRIYSPEHRSPPNDDALPYGNIMSRRSGLDPPVSGTRSSVAFSGSRSSSHHLKPSVYTSDVYELHENDYEQSFYSEELVFRILCPNEKIGSVTGEDGGRIKWLREDVGVNIKITDPVPGSEERIIIISENEIPDDDLFPAQEALLHIQTCIVDLGPDRDDVITTRLLVPSSEIGCLHGKGGSILSEIRRQTRANIQILPREYLPPCALGADELVQIVGDIQVSREALMQVTSRLRRNLHRELSFSGQGLMSSLPSLDHLESDFGPGSPGRSISSTPGFRGSGRFSNYQSLSPSRGRSPAKDADSGSRVLENKERSVHEAALVRLGRSAGGVVTKTTVEVVIPEYAIAALTRKSENNIAQISEVAETRFASHTIVLRRLVKVKEALKHMVISAQWGIWKNSNTARAINVRRMILDEDWWGLVNYVLEITDPIMAMLRFADSDQPCLGDIYDSMDSMLEKIKMAIQRRENDPEDTLYKKVEKIVHHRWNKMTTPLHLLAYALSPRYYSAEVLDLPGRVPPFRDAEVADGYKKALAKIFQDPEIGAIVRSEFAAFNSGEDFLPIAIADQSRMSAIKWWYLHGQAFMYLQPLAIKVLSQMSGATVNLLEVRPGFEKVVEISGSPEQTHRAQSLLHAFILKAQELESQS